MTDPGYGDLAFADFRELRLCQSARGRSRTRVESRSRGRGAPSRDVWRTTFRRLFLGKRSATLVDDIGAVHASKTLYPERVVAKCRKLQELERHDVHVP